MGTTVRQVNKPLTVADWNKPLVADGMRVGVENVATGDEPEKIKGVLVGTVIIDWGCDPKV